MNEIRAAPVSPTPTSTVLYAIPQFISGSASYRPKGRGPYVGELKAQSSSIQGTLQNSTTPGSSNAEQFSELRQRAIRMRQRAKELEERRRSGAGALSPAS